MPDTLLRLLGEKIDPSRIKKVSSRSGGEYHSPCPVCGGNDRFVVFPEQDGGELCQQHGITGTWACPRHCDKGGDAISYLTEMCGMSFSEACERLGIALERQSGPRPYRDLRRPELRGTEAFTPKVYAAPAEKWREQATKLMQESHERLLQSQPILGYLARRGLTLEAVQAYCLGYIEGEDKAGTGIFRSRSAFGLPKKVRDDGKDVRAIRIARGITIPARAADGSCLRLRIRKRDVDVKAANARYQQEFEQRGGKLKREDKYILVPQPEHPYSAPLMLPPEGVSAALATWVVVEAELDAMAVHHACGGAVGVLSVLTVKGKPDAAAHAALSQAARILVALDFDSEGAAVKGDTTVTAWPWWRQTYATARLWPVPEGKDPGDAVALGVDLREWIFSGMPVRPAAAQKDAAAVAEDAAAAAPEAPDDLPYVPTCAYDDEPAPYQPEVTPPAESAAQDIALPDYLVGIEIPQVVFATAREWKTIPDLVFHWEVDDQGKRTGGCRWTWNEKWAKKPENWKKLRHFDTIALCADVRDILMAHTKNTITAKNFLRIMG